MGFFSGLIEKWAMNDSETALRSFVKAYSYRVCGTLTTIVISFAITGKIVVSLAIGATEMVLKPFIYWVHERAWARITWGRENP